MKQAARELKRLDLIPPASPEHSVIVSYLETMAELPWVKMSEDQMTSTSPAMSSTAITSALKK